MPGVSMTAKTSGRMWYPPRKRTNQIDLELQKLEETAGDFKIDPESFMVRVSACIRQMAGVPEIPQSFLRDWIWIGSQYRLSIGSDSDVHCLAQRYLLFLERLLTNSSSGGILPIQDLRWVTDLAVCDLRPLVGEEGYHSFLSRSELASVDDRLRELRANDEQLSGDESRQLGDYLTLFSDVSSETYFPSIVEMIQHVREQASSDGEVRTASLACLRYVIEAEDVVPDSLGYLGLVDDIYAVERTCRELAKRTTWEPVLHGFASRWPFLDRVAFAEGSSAVRLSDFTRAVQGKLLHSAEVAGIKACMVMPEVAFNGILAAFLCSIHSIRNQTSENGKKPKKFVRGDEILLGDAEKIIRARYAGTMDSDGIS